MSHHENSQAFSRRYGRGWMKHAMSREDTISGELAIIRDAVCKAAHAVAHADHEDAYYQLRRVTEAADKIETISSPANPAPAHGLAAGTTGAGEGPVESVEPEQGGANGVTVAASTVQEPSSSPSTHSAGGGEVSCLLPFVLLAAADRWATIAVIVIILAGYAVAIIRANRPPRPHTPPRGPFAGRGNLNPKD